MCTGVHVSFIATLYVNPAQAIWPLDEVPRLTASALNPIPNHEAPGAFEWLRVEHIGGNEKYSALTTEDKKQVAKRCKALGLPSLLEFTSCEGIGPHLEVFNTAPSRPAWLLGYMPPSDPFHVQRVARFVDEKAHAKALEEAIRRGEIVQRLSNGTVLDGHIKIQGAVLARHDLEKFCASLLIDVQDKDTRPVFDVPVRPLAVPDALIALPADAEVRYNHAPCAGWSGGGAGKAADLINAIREVIERQAAGRFTLREAAQIVADVHGVDAQWLLKRMTTAIDSPIPSERLKAYGADTRVARMPGEPRARVADYVKAPEFNAWLASVGDGLELPWQDSEHHSSEINVDTEGLSPHSLGAIAIEAAKLKAWNTQNQASERAKDVCKASSQVFLSECLSRLYFLLEGGKITATNPVGGFPYLAGTDDPKWPGWQLTANDKAKALAMLGVRPDACLTRQEEDDQGQQTNRARDSWNLVKPLKPQGYNMALYSVLKRAHDEGKSCPKPREVLEKFREDKPACVTRVLPASFEYLSGEEIEERTVSLDALGEAIRRMTKKSHE